MWALIASYSRAATFTGALKNPNVRQIPNSSHEQWERELASFSSETRLWLVERAEKAASSNGILKWGIRPRAPFFFFQNKVSLSTDGKVGWNL